ncbi:hypothetical protein ACQPVP_05545 [Clostridium nigeriense]|uniref:hypothetical protein n=1 Tax=Clostridium nigeriense TaxID=1805470 RepID=UPI003D354D5F
MKNISEKRKTIGVIAVLVVIIFYQFIKLFNYNQLIEQNDVEFRYTLDMLSNRIESIEESRHSQIVDMSGLASATGQAYSVYRSTSFYNKNELLSAALMMLNNNLTNVSNIEDVLNENDLSILIPVIEKLQNNPLDEKVTEEFYYLVRKHTVIGSPLP